MAWVFIPAHVLQRRDRQNRVVLAIQIKHIEVLNAPSALELVDDLMADLQVVGHDIAHLQNTPSRVTVEECLSQRKLDRSLVEPCEIMVTPKVTVATTVQQK